MKMTRTRAKAARRVAQFGCLGMVLCLAAFGQRGHGGAGQHSAPHASMPPAPRPQMQAPHRVEGRTPQVNRQVGPHNPEQYGRPSGNVQGRPGNPYNGSVPPGLAPNRAQSPRPPYAGSPYVMRPNPQIQGHLPQWMAQHDNLPIGQQDRLLRQEPGFNRLSPADQQRQIQELHRLNQMPAPQRERRLARAEAFERLSPGEQMQVRQSARDEQNLPPDRRVMLRRAFQDLRGVPMDQRQIILNSARYSATFSPQERGILSNLLRVEPYQQTR